MAKRKPRYPLTVSIPWELSDFKIDEDEKPYTVNMTLNIVVHSNGGYEIDSMNVDAIEPADHEQYRVAITAEQYINECFADDADEWHMIASKVAQELEKQHGRI